MLVAKISFYFENAKKNGRKVSEKVRNPHTLFFKVKICVICGTKDVFHHTTILSTQRCILQKRVYTPFCRGV